MNGVALCAACSIGYHAPFDRFREVVSNPKGPTFLMACKRCHALWHETLRDARLVDWGQVRILYPDFVSLADALAQKDGGDFDFDPPRSNIVLKHVDFDHA